MSILLTGGAGYIGVHTAVELTAAGFDVILADNLENSSPLVMERLRELTGQSMRLYEVDVAEDAAGVEGIFAENQIEGVIHLAGLKAVGESVELPLRYYRNNLNAVLTMLEAMKKYGVKQFVFSSSATVYGVPECVPLTEDMEVSCTNPYGYTKLMAEQILTDTAAADPELTVVLLRYFNPIGAHESGRIGEAPNGIPSNLMPFITQVAVGKRDKLRVFGDDYPTSDGTGVRDYIHVTDLAKGHVAAIQYAKGHRGVEIFNLGTGTGYSVLDIVKTFSRVNEVEIPYEIAARRPGDIAECYADASKAKELLGWKAEKDLEAMCRDSWRWQKNNPEGYESKERLSSKTPQVGGERDCLC